MTSDVGLPLRSRLVNILFLLFLLVVVTVTVVYDVAIYFPLVVLCIWFVVWSYKTPELWLFFAILFHAIFLQRTEAISTLEILFGLYFYGFLGYWFIDHTLINARGMITDPVGRWLFGFLLVAFLSLIVAVLSNGVLSLWLREVLTTSVLFLFFPAREILKTDRGKKLALAALVILSVGLAMHNVMMYSSSALAAEYYGGLVGRRQPVNVHFFYMAVVLAASVMIHGIKGRRYPLITLAILAVNAAALVATFTRGFWIATLISLMLLFILAEGKKKIGIMIGAAAALFVGAGTLFLAWGDLGTAVIASVGSRFASSGEALQDVSFTNRIAESIAVVDAILRSPFIGQGFGSSFRYLNLITTTTQESWYSHNGYLFLVFKVGLIGAAVFLCFYAVVLWQGYRLARFLPVENADRPFVHGAWAILVSYLVVTLTSNVFIEREALLLIALGAALFVNLSEENRHGTA